VPGIAAELRVAAINVGKPQSGRQGMEKMADRRRVELTPARSKLMEGLGAVVRREKSTESSTHRGLPMQIQRSSFGTALFVLN
jgi:hypothetical protein